MIEGAPGRAGEWNSFGNNIEEYATTNETDFMGSVTMSPTSSTLRCATIAKAYSMLIGCQH